MDKYSWNESMILDKLQEILNNDNLDDLELSVENLEFIKDELAKNTTYEEINDSAYIVAENIKELKASSNEDIKDYIARLRDYLDNTSVKFIKAEYKGVDFEVSKGCNIDKVFNEYYKKYDEMYGISDLLSDLGLK
ncbi:MAG: hypothetical protein ACRDA3_06835 [Peptostreptococcaceae bacterium]